APARVEDPRPHRRAHLSALLRAGERWHVQVSRALGPAAPGRRAPQGRVRMTKQGPHYRVPFRRRREGRTDYRHRSRLLRSGKPRAVVRKTLEQTIVPIGEPAKVGDTVLAAATSRDLVKQGWGAGTGNVPAAYLTGYLAGRRAVAKGI